MKSVANDILKAFNQRGSYLYCLNAEDTKLMVAKNDLINALNAYQLDYLNKYTIASKLYQRHCDLELIEFVLEYIEKEKKS